MTPCAPAGWTLTLSDGSTASLLSVIPDPPNRLGFICSGLDPGVTFATLAYDASVGNAADTSGRSVASFSGAPIRPA